MISATSISTDLSTENDLERSADNLLKNFELPIKRELRSNTTDEVKRATWEHLENSLRGKYPKASNLEMVLKSAKTRLEAAIDKEAEKQHKK